MIWILTISFWRNRRRYLFFITALTLTTVVSSLGLSGVDLLSNMWRRPVVEYIGGHIMVRVTNGDQHILAPAVGEFSRAEVSELITELYPEALLTYTLIVPSHPYGEEMLGAALRAVTGREGGLDNIFLSPPWRSGESVNEQNKDRPVFSIYHYRQNQPFTGDVAGDFLPGELALATYDQGRQTWRLAGATSMQIKITGTNGSHTNRLFTHLETLQRLSGAPADLVSHIGIALPWLQSRVDRERLVELRQALQRRFPQLEAVTVDDFAAAEAAYLLPLQQSSRRYLPVVIGIGLLVVTATALAVVQSRRRELASMRVLGMSKYRTWGLIVCECCFAMLVACGLGILLTKALGEYLFAGGPSHLLQFLRNMFSADVSLLPFLLAAVTTFVVAGAVGIWAVSQDVTEVMRG